MLLSRKLYTLSQSCRDFYAYSYTAGLLVGWVCRKMMSNQVLVERVSNKVSSGGTTNDLTSGKTEGMINYIFLPHSMWYLVLAKVNTIDLVKAATDP